MNIADDGAYVPGTILRNTTTAPLQRRTFLGV